MTSYALMIHENEPAAAEASPQETSALLERHAAFAKELRKSGALVDGERLRPSAEAKRVRRRKGKLEVTSGPFADGGRALAGTYVVEAKDLDAATELAKKVPTLPDDEVEARPVMGSHLNTHKMDKPGKVFAFAVLGNEATEAAWIAKMDRIDEETRGDFPAGEFLGGMRLETPTKGRTVRSAGRTVLDGPFFESKEVIGGVFFMRFASMDEAVRFASETPFVIHGSLEIREVWRS